MRQELGLSIEQLYDIKIQRISAQLHAVFMRQREVLKNLNRKQSYREVFSGLLIQGSKCTGVESGASEGYVLVLHGDIKGKLRRGL